MVKSELNRLIDEAFNRPSEYGLYQGVRKFNHGEMFKNVWFVHSIKNQANIACETDLEKQLCMRMEHEIDVNSYRPQPFRLLFDNFSYTPDFIVKFESGLYAIREAKLKSEVESSSYKERFIIVREYCEANGVEFEVFTDADVHKKAVRHRDFLYHLMRGSSFSETLMDDCIKALHQHNFMTAQITELKEFVSSLGFNPAVIFHLIARELLVSNLDRTTGNNAYVSLPGGDK